MLMVNELSGFGAEADSPTKLLLHFDGADGATTALDVSHSNHVPVLVGNAQLDTAQAKFGVSSLLLDGSGDYLKLDGNSDFAFGTGDFTIEMWVRLATGLGNYIFFFDFRPASATDGYPVLYMNTANKLMYSSGATDRITATTSLTTGVWHHLAVTRASGSTRMFLNGAQEGSTYTDSNNYSVGATDKPYIGGYTVTPASYSINGWSDEVRIMKGIAWWTANFTPPTAPYNI